MRPPLLRPVPLLLAACACAHAAPTGERPPLQSDVSRCVFEAVEHGDRALNGRAEVDLLVRSSGQVYAAFVRAAPGVDDKPLCICLASMATRWKLPAVETDYWRPYPIAFAAGGTSFGELTPVSGGTTGQEPPEVFLPDIDQPGEALPFDEELARRTVEVLSDASHAEAGIAFTHARAWPRALEALREALAQNADDPLALRGLAQALAESGGDLDEARRAAQRLLEIRPDSEASHEAMLRVCLAAKDDACVFREFMAARKSPDLPPRSRILHDLQPGAELAAARLRAQRIP